MSFLRLAIRTPARPRLAFAIASAPRIQSRVPPRAHFAAAAGLSKDEIQTRVLDVLKGIEKVDPAKLTASSSFANDLGLDSLDAVEVVMAVEEACYSSPFLEFSIEIPDEEADEILTVQQAIDYVAKTPEAH
ncbi:acyl carrier protein [Punctularia strigosozonata HHB-11173 SS5]|uniref:acyl carrier protein n=1 Tax=Punctularia strigosozonata (strain HHB-11173) TaxID=741275 RepID=UPI00044165D0|nr:acyl carrier protein [Punctularia strigosozonata HHB-11173 SS5]EIN14206.1 acyl carrier protein [Punctularia strigosozonata HHB-11173 SS5]